MLTWLEKNELTVCWPKNIFLKQIFIALEREESLHLKCTCLCDWLNSPFLMGKKRIMTYPDLWIPRVRDQKYLCIRDSEDSKSGQDVAIGPIRCNEHFINKRVRNAVLGCNLKSDRMISVHFQGKPFNTTVIQSMPQPVMLKKLKLNGSMKTYKTF